MKIRDKEINYRKWKVKDKIKFLNDFKNNDDLAADNLVRSCLEKQDLILSDNELKLVMFHMRSESIGDTLSFDIDCEHCNKIFKTSLKILDIMNPNYSDFKPISIKNIIINIGEIPNQEYYSDSLRQCKTESEKFLVDFVYHIKNINGMPGSFEDFMIIINNLDIDIAEDIFKEWDKIRVTFKTIHDIKCENCSMTQKIRFDELIDFFPSSWFE